MFLLDIVPVNKVVALTLLAVKLLWGVLRPIVSGRQGACLGFCGDA